MQMYVCLIDSRAFHTAILSQCHCQYCLRICMYSGGGCTAHRLEYINIMSACIVMVYFCCTRFNYGGHNVCCTTTHETGVSINIKKKNETGYWN